MARMTKVRYNISMPASKKRYFTRNKKKVYRSVQDRTSIGNSSGKTREITIQKELSIVKQHIKNHQEKKAFLPSKKSSQPQKFPNIHRFIAEHSPKNPFNFNLAMLEKGVIAMVAVILVAIITSKAIDLFQEGQTLYGVFKQRSVLQNHMQLWEDIAAKYSSYRDADFQVALLAYQLKEKGVEEDYLQRVFTIDPSYAPAIQLQKQK